jgi:hypothetical protein
MVEVCISLNSYWMVALNVLVFRTFLIELLKWLWKLLSPDTQAATLSTPF